MRRWRTNQLVAGHHLTDLASQLIDRVSVMRLLSATLQRPLQEGALELAAIDDLLSQTARERQDGRYLQRRYRGW